MKRAILRLTAEEFGRMSLNLGRADENEAVRVEIDLSCILAQEPRAMAYLTVETPSGKRYPATAKMDGQLLVWDVTAADVAEDGQGKIQLTVTGPNGEILKSPVAATRVGCSIRGEKKTPDPVQNWVDAAQKVLDDLKKTGSAVGPASEEKLGLVMVGANLKITKDGVLSVDTASQVEKDNTKPITSAAVHTEIGNIEVLLAAL